MYKEIVIKIEEETYNRIMNGWMPLHKAVNLMENIQKGTPLPKHHGRLIDADNALDYFTTNMNWVDEDDNRVDSSEERRQIFKDYFDGVPTIIEGVKADEDSD